MVTKKAPAKKSSKALAGRKKVAVLVAPPGFLPSLVNRPVKRRLSGSKRIKVVRNPWTLDDIIILLKFVVTYQAGRYLIQLIKLWMDYRKAQKIEVRVGDNELKIEGAVSDKVLEKRIERFRELIKGVTYDDIEVVIPKGARRNIPAKLASKKSRVVEDK